MPLRARESVDDSPFVGSPGARLRSWRGHFGNTQLSVCGILCHLQWRIKAVRFDFARYFRNVLWVCHGEPLSALGGVPDRKSVVYGKSVSVGVDLGGRGISKQTNERANQRIHLI